MRFMVVEFGAGGISLALLERAVEGEPPWVWRRLRTLRKWSHDEEDFEPLFA
ncbi:hypothetical protein ACFQU2_37310 [Siccirubricoccus deserti]|uniref:Uncharacterized protein n=1 Tax=Siccirubricoccus deserti TaxID=2013562 RepID=A0A9X0R322_9PROT|nr:hypothetical protein [Siccirubricoccus deserti]MBC4018936.1 hypothetical protein [Siccirubricoccus deserti]